MKPFKILFILLIPFFSLSALDNPEFDQCGLFPSALSTWHDINSGNNDDVINVETIYGNNLSNTIECEVDSIVADCLLEPLGIDPITLPTFLSVTAPIPADLTTNATLLNATYGNLTIQANANVLFNPSNDYADGSRAVMQIKNLTIMDGATVTFKEGDYWIESWTNFASLTVRTQGVVRLYIQGNLLLTENFLDFNYDGGAGEAKNMFIFVYGNFEFASSGGGSDYDMVAYAYVNGTFTANHNTANSSYTGAVTSFGDITLKNNQQYTYDATGLDGEGFGACGGTGVTLPTGPFDAWDTTGNILNRAISTKISNQGFNLTIAGINNDQTATQTNAGITTPFWLQDMTANLPITGTMLFDSDALASTTQAFGISTAFQNVRVQFLTCSQFNGTTFQLFPAGNCSVVCPFPTNAPPADACFRTINSTDNFAIRPNRFVVTQPVVPDINTLASGATFALPTLVAAQFGVATPTTGYTVPSTSLTTVDTKFTPGGAINPGLNGASFFPNPFNITDGTTATANIAYSDVGQVGIQFRDTTWAAVDATPATNNCSATGTYICGSMNNATFIPANFTLTNVNLNNNNLSPLFTYMSSDLNHSASISATVTAVNALGATTQNFTSGANFWENPVDITFNVTTANTPAIIRNEITTTTNLGFGTNGDAPGVHTIQWNEPNSARNLLFNFTRTKNNALNPFRVMGATDVTLTATSLYGGGAVPVTNLGGEAVAQNATFIYGRTNTPRQSFVGTPGSAPIYYEAYCDPVPTSGIGCNNTLLPNGAASQSTDDPRWFINPFHALAFGAPGVVRQKGGAGIVTINTQPDGNAPDQTILNYNGSNYPYKTTMENNASEWLLYNRYNGSVLRNEFDVTFEAPATSWDGASETNSSTRSDGATKTNRRSMW